MKNGKQFDLRTFTTEAFGYLSILMDCSVDRSVNHYLLEYIANGFVSYGSAEGFIDHIDDWLRKLVHIYSEIGFDHQTNQIKATIDLIDQLIIIDDELMNSLEPIIVIQRKYGLLINFQSQKRGINNTTTLSRFFEYIERIYPMISKRYKGLGSSPRDVSKEVLMDPKSRRLIKVRMEDADTIRKMGILIGSGKDNIRNRKEMLLNFPFTKEMLDN